MRIHIFDNHRQYSDHAFYFVAEHPKLTLEEFGRLLQAWMAYQKEERREDIDRVAIVLPFELAPGLAAYPTQIHSIQEFLEHIRHSPSAGGVFEAATTAIGSLGEELVLKLSALMDEEEKTPEDVLSAAVVAPMVVDAAAKDLAACQDDCAKALLLLEEKHFDDDEHSSSDGPMMFPCTIPIEGCDTCSLIARITGSSEVRLPRKSWR